MPAGLPEDCDIFIGEFISIGWKTMKGHRIDYTSPELTYTDIYTTELESHVRGVRQYTRTMLTRRIGECPPRQGGIKVKRERRVNIGRRARPPSRLRQRRGRIQLDKGTISTLRAAYANPSISGGKTLWIEGDNGEDLSLA